jgi:hypothetical protein
MSRKEITILWVQYESSFGNNGWGGFTGWRFGYIRVDGLVGSFSEDSLDEYDRLYTIRWKDSFRNMVDKIKPKQR